MEEEKLKDGVLAEGDISDEEKMLAEEFCDSDNANDIKLKKEESFKKNNNREWYVSKALNDRITYLHINSGVDSGGSLLFLQRARKNRSLLYKVTVLDQTLPSWLKNMVYTRSLD